MARSARSLLPDQPTPLVDRADELATIRQRLTAGGARLLTLTGPAGVGKTRLALAAATLVADRFPDGVSLVDLAPVRDPALVLPAIARSLGLADTGQPPLPERLRDVLRERTALLVLDNFEQILPAAAALADLLIGCPGLALLVTSRVPLQLRWEQTLRVPPLPVPDLTTTLPPLEALAAIPAVALFLERARAHRADFVLSAQQAPLVAQLAVQLDGLPLALELAAAHLDVLSLPTLVRRLGDRLRLLTSAAPDRPARQQSLEAAIGWSYDLLGDEERRLFRCLGVFVGRVTLDAIAAVMAGLAEQESGSGDELRTLRRLVALAEKSLILPGQHDWEDDDLEPAFGMLETVREYARERLTQHGELAAAQRAHAHYFLALAERADPLLRGRDQRAWYLRLERERANLRAALSWLLDRDDQDSPDGPAEREAGLRLAGALGWFWWLRGYWTEGRRWLVEALARAMAGEGGADLAVRTRALLAAGPLLTLQADFARARAVLEEARALAERRQDPDGIAEALMYLGFNALIAGEVEAGTRLLHEALRRWEALGDPHGLGQTLFFLGTAAAAAGDASAAVAHYTAALEGLDAAGDAQSAGIVHCYLGVISWRRGELPRAAVQVQAGVRAGVALRDRLVLSLAAQAVVVIVGEHADPARRACLLGATDTLAQATGATPAWERLPAGRDVAALRERLARGEEGEWAAAYREGRLLSFDEVAALAQRLLEELAQALLQRDAVPDSAQQPEQASQQSNVLSAREQEVLRLVAQGHSSKVIGQQLFLSPSTVNYHLTATFQKLAVNTRAQAVAEAAQRGLL
jgi:non-specific serine/threonine protein kinase